MVRELKFSEEEHIDSRSHINYGKYVVSGGLWDCEDELRVLMNTFYTRQQAKNKLLNKQIDSVLKEILEYKNSVSISYLLSFFDTTKTTQRQRYNRIEKIKKRHNYKKGTDFLKIPATYRLRTKLVTTYGYNKLDFVKNKDGTTKQLYNPKNVVIRKSRPIQFIERAKSGTLQARQTKLLVK